MTAEQLPTLSVIDPISPAIERVKITLFKPFDLAKWFTIGFCAWLTQLGWGGFNFHSSFGDSNNPAVYADRVQNFVTNNIALITVLGLVALVVGLAVFVTLLWLSSRGKFMFIHCVAQNKAEVKVPWRKFKQHGNNLFVFRLVATIIFFLTILLFIAAIIFPIIILKRSGSDAIAPAIIALVFVCLIMTLMMIAFGLFFKFTEDFAIPIMYLRSCTCINAWRELLRILSAKKGAFALYVLFQIAIIIAIVMVVFTAISIVSCCCCALAPLFIIPYINTVVMLPIPVLQRSYSLCYLAQLGPQYNVFAETVENAETTGPADNTGV